MKSQIVQKMPAIRTAAARPPPVRSGALVPRPPTARARVSNGSDILPGIDQRSATARRYRDIVSAIATDQGGADHLSESRIQLIRRFAAASVLSEAMEARLAAGEPINVGEYSLLASTLVRIASRLGLGRRSRDMTPDLQTYINQRAAREEVDAEAVDG